MTEQKGKIFSLHEPRGYPSMASSLLSHHTHALERVHPSRKDSGMSPFSSITRYIAVLGQQWGFFPLKANTHKLQKQK